MEPYRVIPIHEIVKIIEPTPVLFVGIIPFLELAIALRMFDPGFDMLDLILFKEIFKPAISISIFVSLIGIELSSMIRHRLADARQPAEVVQSFLNEGNAVLSRLRIEFAAGENAPRAIVQNCTHLLAIEFAIVPIQMHQGQAVLPFIPDPRSSALRFVAVYIGQAVMQQNLMNGIMRDMFSVLEFDDLFQPSCT